MLSVNGLFTTTDLSEEYAFSGHFSCAAFECQPGKRTKAGCCPCILGAGGGGPAWHGGTTCPGREDAGDDPLQGEEGGSESPGFYLGILCHTGGSHSRISAWQVEVLPEHPACVLDVYLRMTLRVLAFVTSDASLWTLFFATFLRTFVV